MVECTICTDYDLIIKTILHPSVFIHIFESGEGLSLTGLPDELDPCLIYYEFREQVVFYGITVVRRLGDTCGEVHPCLLPEASGKAVQCAHALMAKLLESSHVESLIAMVPEYNIPAIRVAEKSGFYRAGYIENSWRHNGQLMG